MDMQDAPTPMKPAEPTAAATAAARQATVRYGADSDHLLDKIAVIARYRKIAFAVFVLTAGAIMVQGYSQVPTYLAQARILIEDERSTAMPGITTPENTYWQDPEPYYNTQYRILRGRDLTRRVVKKLNLANVPEFNGGIAGPTGPVELLRQLRDGGFVFGADRDAGPHRRQGRDAVERARVEKVIAQPLGHGGRHRALARGRGPGACQIDQPPWPSEL